MKKIASSLVVVILVLIMSFGMASAHCNKPHEPVPPPAGGQMN